MHYPDKKAFIKFCPLQINTPIPNSECKFDSLHGPASLSSCNYWAHVWWHQQRRRWDASTRRLDQSGDRTEIYYRYGGWKEQFQTGRGADVSVFVYATVYSLYANLALIWRIFSALLWFSVRPMRRLVPVHRMLSSKANRHYWMVRATSHALGLVEMICMKRFVLARALRVESSGLPSYVWPLAVAFRQRQAFLIGLLVYMLVEFFVLRTNCSCSIA